MLCHYYRRGSRVAFKLLDNLTKHLLEQAGIQYQKPIITIALHKHKAIYFPIFKVATSSLQKVCANLLHINISKGIYKLDGGPYPSIKRKELAKYEDYFKFCFVRNPWDRLVSCYSNKIKKDDSINNVYFVNGVHIGLLKYNNFFENNKFKAGMSFEAFVSLIMDIPDADSDGHFRSQHTFITDGSGKKIVDFIGNFESLNSDFAYVCERLGIGNTTLPHRLKGNHEYYKAYYTRQLRDMVGQRYSKDIEMFGYKF